MDIIVSLDEVIDMPKWDLTNLNFEKNVILHDVLAKKKKKEKMKREQHKKVLHDIKDIFVNAFDIHHIDEKCLIISQLV